LRRVACGNFAPYEPRYRSDVGPYTAAASGVITDAGVTGKAKLRVHGDHVTVELKGDGLVPGKTYPAHVHIGHCTDYGPHFKYDETFSSAIESNEVWLSLTADNNGKAHDKVDRPIFDTTQALSIVIHEDSSNPPPLRRIACGDFAPEHV
jgi:Cu-Zn family superoxide dismutase